MDKNAIGERLKNLRGERTIRQAAASIGISYSTLAMYENGHRTPKDEIKIRIANFYGTSVEELFFTA
jgi:transcriptional regulator with XRE-family HTH domain